MTYSDMLDAIVDERTQLAALLTQVLQENNQTLQSKNLQAYAVQLSSLAIATNNFSLIDLCMVWQQNLQIICAQDKLTQEFDLKLLQTSDSALQQYLAEPDKYALLLSQLQSPQWPMPLSEQQVQEYKQQFAKLSDTYLMPATEADIDVFTDDANEGFFGSTDEQDSTELEEQLNALFLTDTAETDTTSENDPEGFFDVAIDDALLQTKLQGQVPIAEENSNANLIADKVDDDFFDLPPLQETDTVTDDSFFDLDDAIETTALESNDNEINLEVAPEFLADVFFNMKANPMDTPIPSPNDFFDIADDTIANSTQEQPYTPEIESQVDDNFFDTLSDDIPANEQEDLLVVICNNIENTNIPTQDINVSLLEMIAGEMQQILSELDTDFNNYASDQHQQALEHYSSTLGHLAMRYCNS